MLLHLLIVLLCIIVGARLGGMGLGVMGGLGVALLTFVFGLQPTSPPVDVMLMIAAVISAAASMQAAGGLDYKLSRYACYLIVQNANPKLKQVALGQTYFAIQTRKQELSEKEYNELTEEEKRFYKRNQTRKGNYSLNIAARNAGVKNFDKFHNSGYKGLYNGETADDIAKRKKLRYREDILDNMGSEELAANLFRISQTESKLKKENIKLENDANEVHYEVGKEIRNTIKKLGGTMPENIPTPDKSLKELEKENIKLKD